MIDEPRAAKPSVFRVMLGEAGWTVREEGGEATSFTTRREALSEARRRAQGRSVARVIVHYADATVERQILFHGEPRSVSTWRAIDAQRSGSKSTE